MQFVTKRWVKQSNIMSYILLIMVQTKSFQNFRQQDLAYQKGREKG